MWVVLKALGWIGIGLVAWLLLSIVCLCFMYARGWLSPRRAERFREYEDAHCSGDAAVSERRGEEVGFTSDAAPRRVR
jgi:hypothetical protein